MREIRLYGSEGGEAKAFPYPYQPVIANKVINMKTLNCKIPPSLPLPKGGIMPLFGKEGLGEIFQL